MSKSKTSIVYARVSDHKQVESELSIPAQVEKCKEKAHSLGAAVDRVFIDEGISASSDNRPGFIGSIEYCEMMSTDYMIVWSSSRFARNRLDSAIYKKRLDDAGTKLIYITMSVDRDTVQGRMFDGILEIFDEHKSIQTSIDTKRSLIQNAKNGYYNGGRVPFGFRLEVASENKKKKKLKINDIEAKIVKKIFNKRIEGVGIRGITLWLNTDGIKNRNRKWSKSTIANLLRSHEVIGKKTFDKCDRITGKLRRREDWIIIASHDPIIPIALWNSVQKTMDTEMARTLSSSPHSRFVFTGLLKCGLCGGSITTASGTSQNGETHHYYLCSEAKDKKTHQVKRIRASSFDVWLIEQISDTLFTEEALTLVLNEMNAAVVTWRLKHQSTRQGLLSQIGSLQNKVDKLYEIFELNGKDTPGLSDMTKRLRNHNNNIQALEYQLHEMDSAKHGELIIGEDELGTLSEFLLGELKNRSNIKTTRAFFASFVDCITINSNKATVEYRPEYLLEMNRVVVRSEDKWLPNLDSNQGQTD